MGKTGAALIGGGIGLYFYGWIGRQVERRWEKLDPGPRRLTGPQQFALARQRAIMRQGPLFRRLGAIAVAVGVTLVALAAILG